MVLYDGRFLIVRDYARFEKTTSYFGFSITFNANKSVSLKVPIEFPASGDQSKDFNVAKQQLKSLIKQMFDETQKI